MLINYRRTSFFSSQSKQHFIIFIVYYTLGVLTNLVILYLNGAKVGLLNTDLTEGVNIGMLEFGRRVLLQGDTVLKYYSYCERTMNEVEL